ncbi:hypothetical protein HN681_04910 [archaeon]|jgi:hypothetical protein|nr:hypothetical protein [archaeon]MBT3730476.1 hypothetical protein [archaeon]MBT4670459.1 hypothetical protein [archaeon]MBT5030074.1 hypothetical protein [archaeon]MBT5288234.1 hypothetical protein [archaeon]
MENIEEIKKQLEEAKKRRDQLFEVISKEIGETDHDLKELLQVKMQDDINTKSIQTHPGARFGDIPEELRSEQRKLNEKLKSPHLLAAAKLEKQHEELLSKHLLEINKITKEIIILENLIIFNLK